ncbi:hypothetical protein I5M32_02385 [Pedobacter sp. SD-b]|uniref:Chain length determinant protein n=1 Tax=Pedobacter segetis TaxID=2793069 RepID=A0ABS1BG10_9SPHI|nr:hypothetical protein [Pedobacter segetis]MBK0381796.1 hypothetical protein [Pedobacter segetis]
MEDIDNNESKIEIDLHAFLKIIKAEKKIILIAIFLSVIIGSFYAIYYNSEPKFVAVGKIMPEVASKPTNGLGGLYEILKKYNSNSDVYNTDITRPELYGEIINTKAFFDYLISKKVETANTKEILFKTYCNTRLMPESVFHQNEKEFDKVGAYSYQEIIQKRIEISTSKNKVVSVSVEMPDQIVAAKIANYTIDYLIDFIIKYRTKKARQELLFVENLINNTPKEGLSKEVKSDLLASLVQMKIKIQEDTPVIQVLEYASIPVFKSNQSNIIIILPFMFLGLIIGIFAALFKNKTYKIFL